MQINTRGFTSQIVSCLEILIILIGILTSTLESSMLTNDTDNFDMVRLFPAYNDLIASPQIDLGGKSGNLTVHAASQSS